METRDLIGKEPAVGFDSLIYKEYNNGERAGINLFMRMPELVVQDFSEQLEEYKQEIKDGN